MRLTGHIPLIANDDDYGKDEIERRDKIFHHGILAIISLAATVLARQVSTASQQDRALLVVDINLNFSNLGTSVPKSELN